MKILHLIYDIVAVDVALLAIVMILVHIEKLMQAHRERTEREFLKRVQTPQPKKIRRYELELP